MEIHVIATPKPEIAAGDDDDTQFLRLGSYVSSDSPQAALDTATGVRWRYSIVGPNDPDGDGAISMIQLMNARDTEILQDGSVTLVTDTRGAAIPDGTCIFYAGEQVAVAASSLSTSWHSGDPPSSLLDSTQKRKVITDTFTDYFIYKSDHRDSIWVSVASYSWKFQASAFNRSRRHADFLLLPGYAVNGTSVMIPDYTEPEWIWPAGTVGLSQPGPGDIECGK